MTPRGLDPKMIAKIHDIVEMNFSKMFARLDARLADQAKKVKVEEVGFADQFVELDGDPVEQLEVVAEVIPNLVDAGIEVGFHDQLVESDMETTKNLVMDDPVAVGGELCIVEHLVVSNEIDGVLSLACVDGNFHVVADVELVFVGVDSLVSNVDEVFLVKHYV